MFDRVIAWSIIISTTEKADTRAIRFDQCHNDRKLLKIRLIIQNSQEIDPLPTGKKNNNDRKYISKKGFLAVLFVFSTFVLINFSVIRFVVAGFNFTYEIDPQKHNSQNLDLLQTSSISPSYVANTGGGELNVVDSVALATDSSLIFSDQDLNKLKNYGKISVYEVREGDTLSQIAEMFDVSINTIRWANDFSGPIRPGQTLVILPVTGLTHTVKNGGTIEDVAKIYDADVREIALFNGLDVDVKLNAGDEIIVPNVDPKPKEEIVPASKTSSQNIASAPSGTATVSSGYYRNPVPGSIVTQGLHGYNAIDFGAPSGTPVLAAASGRVITSKDGGWNGGYGSYIIISHANGTQTLYSHQSRNIVAVGQNVSAGEVIGYVGSTGRSTGPHLHFEVRGAKNPFTACRVGSVCNIK